MRPDQERVRSLLVQTVSLLCRNGLQFESNIRIEGLLGVTLDDSEVFLININELYGAGRRASGGALPNILGEYGINLPPQMIHDNPHLLEGSPQKRRHDMKRARNPKQASVTTMRRMKQKGQGLKDVLDYDKIKNMTEEEEEAYWDAVGDIGYDGEHEMRALYQQGNLPPQQLNDMTQYQNEIIDLIDDEDEEDTMHSKSKRSKPHPGSKSRKRPNSSKDSQNTKARKTENGEPALEEMDDDERQELDNLNLEASLESLLGKYNVTKGKNNVDTETEQLEGNETDAAQEISKEQKDDSPTSSTTDQHGKNTKGKTDTDIALDKSETPESKETDKDKNNETGEEAVSTTERSPAKKTTDTTEGKNTESDEKPSTTVSQNTKKPATDAETEALEGAEGEEFYEEGGEYEEGYEGEEYNAEYDEHGQLIEQFPTEGIEGEEGYTEGEYPAEEGEEEGDYTAEDDEGEYPPEGTEGEVYANEDELLNYEEEEGGECNIEAVEGDEAHWDAPAGESEVLDDPGDDPV